MGPGRAHQSVVNKFWPFGHPPRPPRDKKEGRDDGVGKGDPMRATGRKCSPTQSRRFSAGCPLPTLRTAANASSSRLLLGKLTSREDLPLQVRILAQKQEICSSRPWEGRGIRYRPSEVRGNPGIPPPRNSEGPPVLLRARGPGPLPSWKILHVPLARFFPLIPRL